MSSNVRSRYITDAVDTVSPGKLVVMLYDRLALDLHRAHDALLNADIGGAHHLLVHAQDIVAELQSSLDVEKWPAGRSLVDIYAFLQEQLVHANVRKSAATVRSCIELVEPLREAWYEVAGLGPAQPIAGGAGEVAA
jgi:flagellar protein FliS